MRLPAVGGVIDENFAGVGVEQKQASASGIELPLGFVLVRFVEAIADQEAKHEAEDGGAIFSGWARKPKNLRIGGHRSGFAGDGVAGRFSCGPRLRGFGAGSGGTR